MLCVQNRPAMKNRKPATQKMMLKVGCVTTQETISIGYCLGNTKRKIKRLAASRRRCLPLKRETRLCHEVGVFVVN